MVITGINSFNQLLGSMQYLLLLSLVITGWFFISCQYTSSLILSYIEQNYKDFALTDTHYYHDDAGGDNISLIIVLKLTKNGRLYTLKDEYINSHTMKLQRDLKLFFFNLFILIFFFGYIFVSG